MLEAEQFPERCGRLIGCLIAKILEHYALRVRLGLLRLLPVALLTLLVLVVLGGVLAARVI